MNMVTVPRVKRILLLLPVLAVCVPLVLWINSVPAASGSFSLFSSLSSQHAARWSSLANSSVEQPISLALSTGQPKSELKATDDIVRNPDEELQRLYLQRLKSLPYVHTRLRRGSCNTNAQEKPCFALPCNESFLPPEERLQHMLGFQYPVEEKYKKVIDGLTDRSGFADIVLVTAASENHYIEGLGVLHGLEQFVFPQLRKSNYTFKFLYYDLGLSRPQVKKLEEYGNITQIIRVPIENLPNSFRSLGTCAWKPLLIMANMLNSQVTVWMDASTRFRSGDFLREVFQHARERGVFITNTYWLMPAHLAVPALRYFRVQPCIMSSFNEMAGGFIGMHNDQVVREAILGPWVSCAFSPECMCPGKDCYGRLKPCNNSEKSPYSKCHRFDQATLGLILVSLFDWKATGFYGKASFSFSRSKYSGFKQLMV